jgi:hypothetical protein
MIDHCYDLDTHRFHFLPGGCTETWRLAFVHGHKLSINVGISAMCNRQEEENDDDMYVLFWEIILN